MIATIEKGMEQVPDDPNLKAHRKYVIDHPEIVCVFWCVFMC